MKRIKKILSRERMQRLVSCLENMILFVLAVWILGTLLAGCSTISTNQIESLEIPKELATSDLPNAKSFYQEVQIYLTDVLNYTQLQQ